MQLLQLGGIFGLLEELFVHLAHCLQEGNSRTVYSWMHATALLNNFTVKGLRT